MEPDKHLPEQILDPGTIDNLETARAALRWSLERLKKTEAQVEDLSRHLEYERHERAKTVEEQTALQRSLSLRSNESDQRELYYAKLEEFLSLKLEGKIDLAGLAKRELETVQLQEMLRQKQVHLDKEFALKRGGLERDYQNIREQLEEDYRARSRQVEQQGDAKRGALERDHLAKMADVHEKEAQVRQESRVLEERQAHFAEYYEARRAELSAQLRNARAEVEDQARFRIETAERMLGERLSSIELAWTQEKALLVQELDSWRRRAREAAPKVVELERAIVEIETAAAQQRAAVERMTIVFESERATWRAERESLISDAAGWRERSVNQVNEVLSLKEAAAAADEEARHARAQTDQQRALYEQSKTAIENERAAMLDLSRQLAVAEETLSHARSQKASLEAELAEARAKARDSLPRLAELEKGLAAAEETEGAVERQLLRFDEERKAWQRERETLTAELSAERQKGVETLTRLLDMEKTAAVAEEAAMLVQATGERQAARFDLARKAWEQEREQLRQRSATTNDPGKFPPRESR